jgi:hypothetical protein
MGVLLERDVKLKMAHAILLNNYPYPTLLYPNLN